ncbi:MAG: diaminopimelate epimerase [Lachnospiraceae bacterium]|nr:diaminopimelate epimerase [Lachnospiraceae bacterium]
MKFTKMHGIGNDYVYVNCFQETIENPSETAKIVSDRHFGIGSDGLILIKPSEVADFEMEMYNADGSLGAMCGNGIRCVAKYVYDYGLTDKTQISVATGSGIKYLELTVENGRVALVKVDMGAPILEAGKIPADVSRFAGDQKTIGTEDTAGTKKAAGTGAAAGALTPDSRVVSEKLLVQGRSYDVTCVSMGNPHCIVCVDDVDGLKIEEIGPAFECHPAFPDRVNTEFIRVLDRSTVQMRVWERGSGETWACGTGACAVAVACMLNGWTEDAVTVKLRGGDLHICWDKEKNTVFMTGPAATVFDGEIQL